MDHKIAGPTLWIIRLLDISCGSSDCWTYPVDPNIAGQDLACRSEYAGPSQWIIILPYFTECCNINKSI